MSLKIKTGLQKLGPKFFISAFDSLSEQIAIIDQTGEILFVNQAWKKFGEENNGPRNIDWIGINYLEACQGDFDETNNPIDPIRDGVIKVIKGLIHEFSVDYPCDSPISRRWFSMRIARLQGITPPVFIISHFDITERRKKEEESRRLALTDSLTSLPNRRHFNEFIEKEWSRAIRSKSSISCIMVDIDHFKKLNDKYGHLIGDECLAQVSLLLSHYCRRENDIVARLGGEEFALIFININDKDLYSIAESIRVAVTLLKLPLVKEKITVSCGLATMKPSLKNNYKKLIACADEALYEAKSHGRNQSVAYKEQTNSDALMITS